MNRIIVNKFGGGYSTTRKEASVRFVSEQISERRFEAR